MNRSRFLYDIINEIKNSVDKYGTLKTYVEENKHIKSLIDICYNNKYDWEFEKNVEIPVRIRGRGLENNWEGVLRLIQNKLLKYTKTSPRLVSILTRSLELSPREDIEIILEVLQKRSIKGFTKKKIHETFPELTSVVEDAE